MRRLGGSRVSPCRHLFNYIPPESVIVLQRPRSSVSCLRRESILLKNGQCKSRASRGFTPGHATKRSWLCCRSNKIPMQSNSRFTFHLQIKIKLRLVDRLTHNSSGRCEKRKRKNEAYAFLRLTVPPWLQQKVARPPRLAPCI